MTTLVTGADGLLGSQLVRELLRRGDAVRALVQPGSTSPTLDGLDVERITGDLLDQDSVLAAVTGTERVVHCAAITDMWAAAELHWAVNLEGTRHVAEACLKSGSQRMLLVGSASAFQFGSLDHPGDEKGGFPAAYAGIAYMESKHAAIDLVRSYVAERGLDAVVVAPTFLLGDHDWRPSSGELLLEYVRRGIPVVPPGGRNFAFAPDVAVAALNALERAVPGDCTILAGHNLTYMEFFTRVAQCAGAKPPRYQIPPGAVVAAGSLADAFSKASLPGTGSRQDRKPSKFSREIAALSVLDTYYDNSKARAELGMPLTPIRTAIRSSLKSLRDFGHLPPDPLDGKVAIVSGASRGVGLATARALTSRGVRVVMTARGEPRLDDSCRVLESEGAEVRSVAGDVSKWGDAEGMVRTAIDGFGRLDVVVNNAGVSMRGSFADLSPEVCAQTINTNLLGAVFLSRAAIPHIIEASGHILFVSSIAGLIGLPGASTYCASKSALTYLAESLRLEVASAGVHVGVAYIGFTEHDPEKRVLGAHGEALLPDRPAHQTQAQVATELVSMITKRKRQVILTPIGKVGALAHRLSPRLVEAAITRAQASQLSVFQDFS